MQKKFKKMLGQTETYVFLIIVLLALVILYMIAPDLLPGPVDDILVMLLTAPKLFDGTPKKKE